MSPALVRGDKMQEWLTPREAAEILGVHRNTFLRYVSAGLIKVERFNARVMRVNSAEVKRFMTAYHYAFVGDREVKNV